MFGFVAIGTTTMLHGLAVGATASVNIGKNLKTVLFSDTNNEEIPSERNSSENNLSGEKKIDPNLDKNMNQIIPGSVQKSKSWKGQYESKTLTRDAIL